jgi:hypothetical protein
MEKEKKGENQLGTCRLYAINCNELHPLLSIYMNQKSFPHQKYLTPFNYSNTLAVLFQPI